MELSDRIKRPKARAESPSAAAEQVPQSGAAPSGTASSGAPATFDHWLDGRLQALYQTVLNEPLPREILELLSRPKGGDAG
jgi:hypothetical protein